MTGNHLIEKLRGFISERVEGGDMSRPLDPFEMDTIRQQMPEYLDHEFLTELEVQSELDSEDVSHDTVGED